MKTGGTEMYGGKHRTNLLSCKTTHRKQLIASHPSTFIAPRLLTQDTEKRGKRRDMGGGGGGMGKEGEWERGKRI